MTTTKNLKSLSPSQFENLIFDIMIARGMTNVTWRTPGADGGRDIEGSVYHTDFSLSRITSKWYVECKRYTSSIDWPTIYSKVSYADSQNADVLLMCTSSKFTPNAITCVDKWNHEKRTPLIRLWPGHQIDILLEENQDIAIKYGLLTLPEVPTGSILKLSLALSKTVGTYYSQIIFNDDVPTSMLEAAHYIAQLLQKRMEDVSTESRFKPVFFNSKDFKISLCHIDENNYSIDEPGLYAFVSYLIALSRKNISISLIDVNSCLIHCDDDDLHIVERYKDSFDAIAIWSDFEYFINPQGVTVRQRT
ncbi:restriction endonuclease [Aeromonas hydrophila]|uniref:restriction endonuclease n=1 Tax=Aeromonas hydrophila TaxID=644 RepID=UPI00288F6E90|nr:restriction endonuclease [Aeromonas dhakensis]